MRRQISEAELAHLYHAIGRVVWHLQYFEDVLVHYVTMKLKLPKPVSPEEAYKILNKERRNTLGRLIKTADKESIIPQELTDRFYNFLEERNWLIHRSWHQNGEDLYVDSSREAFFDRLSRMYDECLDLKYSLFTLWING